MGTPIARNVAPAAAGSEYAETVRSSHCIASLLHHYDLKRFSRTSRPVHLWNLQCLAQYSIFLHQQSSVCRIRGLSQTHLSKSQRYCLPQQNYQSRFRSHLRGNVLSRRFSRTSRQDFDHHLRAGEWPQLGCLFARCLYYPSKRKGKSREVPGIYLSPIRTFFFKTQSNTEEEKYKYRAVKAEIKEKSVEAGFSLTGLGLNPGEDMDVCKCLMPSQHGGTLNSRRAASPLVRLMEEDERWEALTLLRVFSLKIGGTELNRTVTCMAFKAKANDRRTSSPLP
ncbi:uncharacterized protein TNCV_2115071 [Trichonephila clavipes]|nr:uncharacterized protein TNCV_2115071 [Trichonephila clavipes]